MAINRFSRPLDQTLEQYVPLPFEQLNQAAAAIQQRGDLAAQQQAQTELGLASIEALAPEHRNFVNNYVNDYRTQAGALLDKVGGNTSNPDFVRGIKQLNTQFSSDPRLQVIKQANEKIKLNDQLSAKMRAEGKLFINSPFSGLDARGNLSADVPQIQGVNVLDRWSAAGKIAHDSIVDNGKGWKTNKPNLDSWKQTINNDVEGRSQLMRAYMSQGYTPEQAQQAVETQVQGLVNQYGVKTDRDYEYDRLILAQREAAERRTQQAQQVPANPTFMPLLTDKANIQATAFNKQTIGRLNNVLSNLGPGGGLKKGNFDLPHTEENRRKHPNGYLAPLGVSGEPVWRVPSNDYIPEQKELLIEAARYLGRENVKGLTPKTILERYKNKIEADDVAVAHIRPNNADYIKAINDTRVGNNGEYIGNNWVSIGIDGKIKRSSTKKDQEALKDLKGFTIAGISAQPFDDFKDGTMRINAIDKDNNQVTIFKPLDVQESRAFQFPNLVNQAIQSGQQQVNIQYPHPYTGELTDFVVSQTANGPIVYENKGGRYVPFDMTRTVDTIFERVYGLQNPTKNLN